MGLIYPHIVNLLKNTLAVQGRFLFLNLVVVFTAAADIVIGTALSGREEVVSWEFDSLKHVARLVGSIVTLLFGYTEVVYRNKHLNLTDKLYNREKAECYINRGRSALAI